MLQGKITCFLVCDEFYNKVTSQSTLKEVSERIIKHYNISAVAFVKKPDPLLLHIYKSIPLAFGQSTTIVTDSISTDNISVLLKFSTGGGGSSSSDVTDQVECDYIVKVNGVETDTKIDIMCPGGFHPHLYFEDEDASILLYEYNVYLKTGTFNPSKISDKTKFSISYIQSIFAYWDSLELPA